jgi:hypothetical protein
MLTANLALIFSGTRAASAALSRQVRQSASPAPQDKTAAPADAEGQPQNVEQTRSQKVVPAGCSGSLAILAANRSPSSRLE